MIILFWSQRVAASSSKRLPDTREDELIAHLRREDEEILTFVPAFMEILRRAINR